jgi:hypothetical protein
VPYGADQTVYLVVDRCRLGTIYRETEVEQTDLETIITDLMSGQFNDRCDIDDTPFPSIFGTSLPATPGPAPSALVAAGVRRGL